MRRADQQEAQAKEDRDFANEYATHLPPEEQGWGDLNDEALNDLKQKRIDAGFDPEGMAQSEPAQRWERTSDEAIYVTPAGDIQKQQAMQEQSLQANLAYDKIFNEIDERYSVELRKKLEEAGVTLDDQNFMNVIKSTPITDKAEFLGLGDQFKKLRQESFNADRMFSSGLQEMGEENPFVSKLDPKTKLYSGYLGDLGIDHVVDVIRQDVAAGRIRPDQLNKLSMDQAIKRTADYNKELAQKMNSEKAALREGLPVYREYPEGYRWVELNKPGSFNAESEAMGHSVKGYEPPKGHPDWVEGSGDSGSYGYGYGGWEAIKSGRAKVYSLVDSKGQPHATVEVGQSPPKQAALEAAPKEVQDEFARRFDNWVGNIDYNPSPEEITQHTKYLFDDLGIQTSREINQIKGKGNARPIDKYDPYTQDFVKSGQWERVGDLQNTGLHNLGSEYLTLAEAEAKYKPKIQEALNFLETHPSFEEHRLASQAHQQYQGDFQSPEYKALEQSAGRSIAPNTPYTYRELKGLLTSPEDWTDRNETIYTPISRALDKLSEARKELGIIDEPPIEGMKRGGKVHVSDNPDTMAMELEDRKYQVGGIVDIAARAAKAAKAAQLKQAMKASEALAQIEGKRLNITQADRTKVGQGFLGGPGFSGLQRQEGPHKDVGAVWGVKNVGTAKTMLGGFDKPLGKEYFTTMIGSPTQHQSNQMVFDKLYSQFKSEAKKGNLDPELRDKINARLAASVDKDGNPIFPSDIDILDKNFKKQATTFDQRAVTGNVLGGVGVGGRKGQIFDYDKIIRDTTDPFLLDAPSGSMGYRLWTPSGEIIERPDLHPAFPAIATGEDLGVEFNPAAQDILMEPWVQNIRETKGRNPGYMDWTRGRPPSVEVTEDILTNLQKSGNKNGGLIKVKRKAGGGIMKKALKTAVAPATKRLEMSFKDVAKPVPELTEAAQKLKAGKLSREEYEALVNKHKPVTPYSFVPQPATAEDATRALNSAKREKFGKTKEIPAGTPTGLRLDIPAYKDHGVWVNSVHADDMPTMYDNVSSVTNAEMVMPEDKALSVATREANKSPFAVIKGGWNPMSEEEAVARATEYLNHPDWVQVGIDPERHGYYYNRATMEPIVKAEEVIQIGPLVLAKNPTTAPKEAFKYAMGGAITGDDLILKERPL
jgi:hypothetical protein